MLLLCACKQAKSISKAKKDELTKQNERLHFFVSNVSVPTGLTVHVRVSPPQVQSGQRIYFGKFPIGKLTHGDYIGREFFTK